MNIIGLIEQSSTSLIVPSVISKLNSNYFHVYFLPVKNIERL